jgi:predicted CXXCH cytochrome family protein
MKKIKLALLALVAGVGISLYSCESNTYEEVAGVVENPTYNANVKSIMQDKCTSCHAESTSSQDPYLETYDQVKDACENYGLLCRIQGSDCGDVMPTSGKMPAARIKIIENWIAQGYPEN